VPNITEALKRSFRPWCPPWVYGHVHLFRVLRERWWYDRQEFMDTAHTTKEWDFELSVEQERYDRVLDLASQLYPADEAVHALEIGCSEGVFTRRLAAHCATVTACDISPIARARATERCGNLPNVTIRPFDLQKDSIEGRYDWVIAMDILEYIHGRDRLGRAVDKLARALKQDGLLIVSDCRLPERIRGGWWTRLFPEGADAIIEFINGRSGLSLVHQEHHPNDGIPVAGYFDHIIALFRYVA
jgi:2-polyprenyl-3-methyl-5-hydroxy-6-metoxy-1,4-benzoquinol methylase